MCTLVPHVPIVFKGPYKPTYITKFGWFISGLNDL